ncbi:unnamed protein product [Ilex paraguariensis]|uniref:Uncharacterized protein n=1 Tax=Ilex paraguariensis TaxID=185542 RepID=A0ABC8SAF4_9AQUA
MEETSEKKVTQGTTLFDCLCNPCSFVHEAVKAMLKCLGFESETEAVDTSSSSSSDHQEDKKVTNEPSSQGQGSSSTTGQAIDPISAADPTVDPPEAMASGMPTRPPINTGRGPQTNTSTS